MLLFSELGKLVSFLSQSHISVGYDGIRDHMTPLLSEFFLSQAIDDDTRQQLQAAMID